MAIGHELGERSSASGLFSCTHIRDAHRARDRRPARKIGAWLRAQWHALAEYRWLDVDDGGTNQGFLVGLDRDINQNFRIGLGYNFTEFSDDLTDFDYDHRGWFVNLAGSY